MRHSLMVALALAGLAATAPCAYAQDGLRGPGSAIGGFHLIAMPQVQQDLQLNAEQVGKAKEVADRMNARFQQDMGKMRGLNADERAQRAVTLANPHYEEGMRELRRFLTPAQLDRFDQILFQMRGPAAMLEPAITKALALKNEQARKVAELVARAENEQRAAAKAAGDDRQAGRVKVEAIAARANEEAASILSPEQQRTWGRMTGEPFRPDMASGNSPAARETPKR